jgi:hypothetical protein
VDCHNGKPGENYQAAPVFVRFHDGDWPDARKIYQQWKAVGHPPAAGEQKGAQK